MKNYFIIREYILVIVSFLIVAILNAIFLFCDGKLSFHRYIMMFCATAIGGGLFIVSGFQLLSMIGNKFKITSFLFWLICFCSSFIIGNYFVMSSIRN